MRLARAACCVQALRGGAPYAFLRLPARGAPPVADLMLDNCLWMHAASRQLRRVAAPFGVEEQQWRYDESAAVFLQKFETPGGVMHIPPAARAKLGAPALQALAAAVTAPMPLWLCQHLWRNRVEVAVFVFRTGAALARELAQHVEDMMALHHEPQLAPARVKRVLDALARLPDHPPLSVARAAGPLPLEMDFLYAIYHEDAHIVVCNPSVRQRVAVADGDAYFPELAAVTESLFLTPRDAPLPLAVLPAVGRAPMRCMTALHAPCDVCGGARGTRLYFRASPTWRAVLRQAADGEAEAESGSGSHMAADGGARARQCDCTECDGCGKLVARARRKRCARCRAVWLCGDACMRAFWPSHKAECRAEAARRAAAAAE